MRSTRHPVLEGRRSGARANYMSCDSRPRPTSSSALTSTGVIGSISSSAAPPNPSKSSSACVTPGFAPTRQHARCQNNCICPAARTPGQRPTSQDVPSISGKVGLRRTTRRRDRSGIKGCLARPPEGVESPNQSSPCRRRAHRQVRAPGTLPAQQTKKAACQSLPINSAHVQNLMCSGNVIVFPDEQWQ